MLFFLAPSCGSLPRSSQVLVTVCDATDQPMRCPLVPRDGWTLPPPPLSLAHSTEATLAPMPFLSLVSRAPAAGPLHWLCALPECSSLSCPHGPFLTFITPVLGTVF